MLITKLSNAEFNDANMNLLTTKGRRYSSFGAVSCIRPTLSIASHYSYCKIFELHDITF